MDDEQDNEARELHDQLARHLGERTAALLMKRVMAMEGRDWVTSRDLSELGAAIMGRFEQVDARFDQVDARFEQVDARFEQVDARFEQVDARFEQMDGRFERLDGYLGQVDGRLEHLDGRFEHLDAGMGQVDVRLGQVDERIDARREADDARFAMLADRVDNGFDRIQSDLRGQLLDAVTTQTRTLLLALLGILAVYGGMTVALVR